MSRVREFADSLTTCPSCGHACRVVGTQYEPVHLLADTPSVEPGGQSVRYATGLTGAAYNLLGAIEYGDRANVHRWSVALRKELDAYFLPTQASDSPEKTT